MKSKNKTIILYSPGKTATRTCIRAFSNIKGFNFYNAQHQLSNLKKIIEKDKVKNSKKYIVSFIRDPISINMSLYFQLLSKRKINNQKNSLASMDLEELLSHYNNLKFSRTKDKLINHYSSFEDISGYQFIDLSFFDRNKLVMEYENDDFHFLSFRLEDLKNRESSKKVNNVLSDLFHKNIDLNKNKIHATIDKNKFYYEFKKKCYSKENKKTFLDHDHLSDVFCIYGSKCIKKHYNKKEIESNLRENNVNNDLIDHIIKSHYNGKK